MPHPIWVHCRGVHACGNVSCRSGRSGAEQAGAASDDGREKSLAHNVLCPAPVSVVLDPTAPAAGWQTNKTPAHLTLDTKNPPRIEQGMLICYYAMPDGYNAFVYFQALGNRTCTVRSDDTGFICH